MNVQEFLGSIKVDGDVVSDGNVTAKNMSSGGNLSVINVVANGQISADSLRIGTPNRVYAGERDLNVTVGAGTIIFIGCSGTVNTTGTGAKTMYLIGCPALTVNNNGYAKTYRDGYAVGGILQTTGADSPAEAFGGNWEQLTADAYFKIVTAGAGNTGGSNKHNHDAGDIAAQLTTFTSGIKIREGRSGLGWRANYQTNNSNQVTPTDTTHTALVPTEGNTGDATIEPYYYGVYAWRRINVSGQE